ncbi:MAG: hypothetical protein J0M37_02970 [Ignavibacteria bacterium]|nr:hypothetical protein [Ignavibacteria bacterium]
MHNTRLIKLLKYFPQQDIRRFMDFVRSPFYNKNKKLIKLAEFILKYHPEFSPPAFDEESVFKKLFPVEKYEYQKIKNLLSDLLNLAYNYLRTKPVYFTEFTPELNLIVNLRSLRALDLHEKILNAAEKKLGSSKTRDGIYLYNKFLLADQRQILNTIKKPNANEGFNETFSAQFELSLLNLLKQYTIMKHVSIENDKKFSMKMYEEVLGYIKKHSGFENITLKEYRLIALLLEEKTEEHYRELKKIYIEDYESLDEEDSYMALFYLNSFCAERYNNLAEKKYIFELRDLFKHAFSKDAVALGTFHYPDFIHYAKIFIRAGDIETAEKFIKNYFYKIDEQHKDSTMNHLKALIHYQQGSYEKALYYISKVNFPSFIMKLQVKLIHLQLLIDTQNYEEARAAIHSFSQFLARESTINKLYKSVIKNFLKLCKGLIGVYEISSVKERRKAVAEFRISSEKLNSNLFGINHWLIEKTAKL